MLNNKICCDTGRRGGLNQQGCKHSTLNVLIVISILFIIFCAAEFSDGLKSVNPFVGDVWWFALLKSMHDMTKALTKTTLCVKAPCLKIFSRLKRVIRRCLYDYRKRE